LPTQIVVVGYNGSLCSEKAYRLAYAVGRAVAERGCILVTGGLDGVMEAASKGAKEAGGLVVGIIPQADKAFANPYCDVVVPTGLGVARNYINILCGDAVIIVGGGAGTLNEVAAAYQLRKPLVALKGSGGIADRVADTYIDERGLMKVVGVEDPARAVEVALELARGGPG
jgi:hypothetical protein